MASGCTCRHFQTGSWSCHERIFWPHNQLCFFWVMLHFWDASDSNADFKLPSSVRDDLFFGAVSGESWKWCSWENSSVPGWRNLPKVSLHSEGDKEDWAVGLISQPVCDNCFICRITSLSVVGQHHYYNYNYYKMLQSRAVAAGEYWKQYLQFGQQLKHFSPFSAFRKVLNTQSFLFKSILIMVIWDKTPELGFFFFFLNAAVELTALSFFSVNIKENEVFWELTYFLF